MAKTTTNQMKVAIPIRLKEEEDEEEEEEVVEEVVVVGGTKKNETKKAFQTNTIQSLILFFTQIMFKLQHNQQHFSLLLLILLQR